MKKEFALYKGENLLSIGSIQEIADQMNVKKDTIYFYNSASYKDRVRKRKEGLNGNMRILVSLD